MRFTLFFFRPANPTSTPELRASPLRNLRDAGFRTIPNIRPCGSLKSEAQLASSWRRLAASLAPVSEHHCYVA
jgi:hypothetical protein